MIQGPLDQLGGKINLGSDPTDVLILAPANCGSFCSAMALVDLDGDGCDDVIIGDPNAEPGTAPWAGQVSILFGRTDAPANWEVDWTTTDPDLILLHDRDYAYLGATIATGDFNGDGAVDLAINADSLSLPHAVYLVLGPFLKTTGAVRDFAVDAPDLTIVSPATSDSFGSSMFFGDLDGDGKDDLAIGAPSLLTGNGRGGAYIVFGREVSDSEVQNLATDPADVTIVAGDASRFSYLGDHVYLADLTGDGLRDCVMTDPYFSAEGHTIGAAMMVENSRLTTGASIDLTLQPPDLAVLGEGDWWSYFEHAAVVTPLTASRAAPMLLASAPFGRHNLLDSSGLVVQLNADQLDEPDQVVNIADLEPAVTYHGSAPYYQLGDALQVSDLDGDVDLDLIIGATSGDMTINARGVFVVFFDAISAGDDDDTTDDDTADDDTADDDTADDDVSDDDTGDDDIVDDDAIDDDAGADDDDDDDDDDGCGCQA